MVASFLELLGGCIISRYVGLLHNFYNCWVVASFLKLLGGCIIPIEMMGGCIIFDILGGCINSRTVD